MTRRHRVLAGLATCVLAALLLVTNVLSLPAGLVLGTVGMLLTATPRHDADPSAADAAA